MPISCEAIIHVRLCCEGHIPAEIGELKALTEIHLYHNRLSGAYIDRLSNGKMRL